MKITTTNFHASKSAMLQESFSPSSRIISFDVFDTVVTRMVGAPSSVFLLLGRRLSNSGKIQCSSAAFCEHRMEAERRSRRIVHPHDVTLGTIYRELSASLGISQKDAEELADFERHLETELIRAIPEMRNHVECARKCCDHIVFLSDIYLSSTFIKSQLAGLGLFRKGDSCYVSCESESSKRHGDFFKYMADREAVSLGEILHVGDNYSADILSARKAGVFTKYYQHAHLNRYETILEKYSIATDGLTSVMAGASRMVRLSVEAPTPIQAALRDLSAGVIAPVLTGYVLWLLRRAKSLGLTKLYFVSRDGQILLDIARRISQKISKLDIELSYFYGSRQALRIATLRELDDEALAWILRRTGERSVRSYLARVALTPEDIRASLLSAGLFERDWDKPLTEKSHKALSEVLVRGHPAELILRRAAYAKELLIRYARQEGMLDAGEWGIVDTCGRGQMLSALADLVVEEGAVPPTTFYFQLMEGGGQSGKNCHREAYFCDESRQWGYIKIIPDLTNVIEIACSGDHGLVKGYSEKDSQILPVMNADQNTAAIEAGLGLLRKSCSTFVDNLFLAPDAVHIWADSRAASAELIKKFWYSPKLWEARAWGAMPVETDHAGLSVRPLARPFKAGDIVLILFRFRLPPGMRLWPQGSFAASSDYYTSIAKIGIRLGRRLKAPFQKFNKFR